MARKKHDQDAAADFFGDSDTDWLSEGEDPEAGSSDDGETERLPVAPPPPPAVRTATPIDGNAEAGWANRVTEAPEDAQKLASAPTLVFSSVPTAPPHPAPALSRDDGPDPAPEGGRSRKGKPRAKASTMVMAAMPPQGGAPDEPTPPDPVLDEPTARADRPEPAPEGRDDDSATETATPMPAVVVVEDETREDPGRPAVPVPESPARDAGAPEAPREPGPARVVVEPAAARAPAPAASRPVRPRSVPTPPPEVLPPPDYALPQGADGWRDAIAILRAEAEQASGAGRGALLFTAGRIAARRLNDLPQAEQLLEAAIQAGEASLDAHRLLAEIRGALEEFTGQEQSLLHIAQATDGVDRAEAYLEAALIAWQQRERPTEAVAYLREAAKAVPWDYTSRALLRALLPSIGGATLAERIEVLDQLADLAEGGIAADARFEQAELADRAGQPDEVRRALKLALEASPGHSFAFQRLEGVLAADPPALAGLYTEEARRPGQPDPGWWQLQAGRAWLAAGSEAEATAAFAEAADQGYPFALRELQGLYAGRGAHKELEAVLAREAAALRPEDGQAHALFRLGWLREIHLADIEGALEAYRKAVEVDPTASPAAHAVGRLVGDAERSTFLAACAEATPDPEERRALRLWLAELAESTGDQNTARKLFQQVADEGQGIEAEIAQDGLDRVLQRLADVPALSQLRRARADAAVDTNDRVAWLLLAGSIPADRGVALPMWISALEARPDHPVALAAVSVALELEGRFTELAHWMRAAGEAASDPARKAAYLYRAARVLSEQGGDPGVALACIQQALDAEPKLRSARWLARSLYSVRDPAVEADLYREQSLFADDPVGAGWARFAAGVMCGDGERARADFEAVLTAHPGHAGAFAALEVELVAAGDRAALVGLYRRAADATEGLAGARVAARAAELLTGAGHAEEAVLVLRRLRNVDGAPIRVGARLALSVGAVDRAIELLAASELEEDRVERARLLVSAGRIQEALPLLMDLLSTAEGTVGVAARASSVAQQVGDSHAMIKAYGEIAHRAKSDALRVGYASWTAMQLQAVGRDVEALEYWLIARELRPDSTMALEGAVLGAIHRREPDRIRDLFARSRPDAPTLLADALLQAGDAVGAVEALHGHAEALRTADAPAEVRLGVVVDLERMRCELEDWQGAYDALVERRELCRDAQVRARADAARRWLLSQKLAETDAAWDMYRQLHEDAPYDRQVTDALARIASLRGEVEVAIGYLDELARSADGPDEAARYRCRIGEVHEKAGNAVGARQAYLDALEHVPDDRQALDGLRRLAEQAKDWPGLIAVLQREAETAGVARQIELRRQIARVTEEKLSERRAAMDAWRALLDLDPGDREGLTRHLALAEALGEWQTFVETGDQLVQQLTSRERATLLRKMGIVCQDKLSRNDAVRYYEQAVAIKPPDHEAALRLEGLARGRADWPGVVRALRLQADADVDTEVRVEALLKAARIEVEALHDKEAGAACYARLLELRPTHEGALRFMATFLYDTRRFEEALPICQRLEPMLQEVDDLDDFDSRMDLSTFFYYFGEILRSRGQDDDALPRYEKALELNPSHLPSLEAVGPLYVATEQWPKAERVYRQLLQLSGGQGEKGRVAGMYTALGLVERKLGQPDKAYKRFTKALEIYPNHVGALKGMALILEDRKDWSNLLNVYNNVIYHATVPEDVVDAYMTKGRILDDQMQRQDKAAQHYQRTLDLDPNQPAAYLRLAELAMRRDAFPEAGELAERALQLDPDVVQGLRPLLLVLRAAAWHAVGRTPEGERCLREARMLDPELMKALGDLPLQDLERMRRVIKERLPR